MASVNKVKGVSKRAVLENEIINYYKKHKVQKLTKDELKYLCARVIEYCKLMRYSDVVLETPTLEFADLEEGTSGQYDRFSNKITISEKLLDDILSGKKQLFSLFTTAGHEMEHYRQNSAMIEYDKMSPEQQRQVDEYSREYIDSYKYYFKLSKEDVETFHKLFTPNIKGNEVPAGYSNLESFYEDISFSSYYTIVAERNARKQGNIFLLGMYELCENRKKMQLRGMNIDNLDLFDEQAEDKDDLKYYLEYKKLLENFLDEHIAGDDDKILEVVERIEGENKLLAEIGVDKYSRVLNYLLKTKTLQQKQSLFSVSINKNYRFLTMCLIDSIHRGIDFKSKHNEISSFVRDSLLDYDNKSEEDLRNMYGMDYKLLLKNEDIEKIIIKALERNETEIANIFMSYNNKENYSLGFLLQCQEITRMRNGDNTLSEDDTCFYHNLFAIMSPEEKISYLKWDAVDYKVREQLKTNLNMDARVVKDDNLWHMYETAFEYFKYRSRKEKGNELFALLQKIGVEKVNNYDIALAKDNTPRGVQYAALMGLAESDEAKSVVEKIYDDWEYEDGFDLYAIRIILLLMRNGEVNANLLQALDCVSEIATVKMSYILRDAARIARADNIKYKGDDFAKNIPSEEEIDKYRNTKEESQSGGPRM